MAKSVDKVKVLLRLRSIAKKRGGVCLSAEYISSHVKMQFQCKNEHVWRTVPSSIFNGTWCGICSGNQKVNIESIKAIAEEKGFTCESVVYRGSHTPLTFRCGTCGNLFQMSPTNLKTGKGCRHCYFASRRKPNSLVTGEGLKVGPKPVTKEELTELSDRFKIIFSTTKVSWLTAPINVTCAICENKFNVTIYSLRQRKTLPCLSCTERKPLTVESMAPLAAAYGLICERKEELKNGRPTFVWYCTSCEKRFQKNPDAMRVHPGCPDCKARFLGEAICRLSFETLFDQPFPMTTFPWLKDPTNPNGRNRSVDGYSAKLNYAFEHQGTQHFQFVPRWHLTKKQLREQKRIDQLRLELCQKHGVKLAIVPDLVNVERVLSRCYINGPMIPIPSAVITACMEAGMILPSDYRKLKINVQRLVRPSDAERITELQKIADQSNFKILKPDYPFGNDTKLKAVCRNCEYHWGISPDKIKSGRKCPRCAGNLPLSLDFLKKLASKRNHKIQTTQLKNSQQVIQLSCGVCGNFWTVKATIYKCGPGNCLHCQKRKSSKENKQKIKDFYSKNGVFPKKNGKSNEERRLNILLVSYCCKGKKTYDPDFNDWARKRGYGTKTHQWTKDECRERAIRYTNRGAFQKGDRKAYDSAHNHGWLDEICHHMQPVWGKWNNEDALINESKRFGSITEWSQKSSGSYDAAKRLGLLTHIKRTVFNKGKRILNIETGKLYDSITEAAASIGLSNSGNLKRAIKTGMACGGFHWKEIN